MSEKSITSVGYVDRNIEQEYEPCLRVENSFPDLVPFPYIVHNTGLVYRKASDPEHFLLLRQKQSVHRRVREKHEGENGPRHRYRTDNQVQILPLSKRRVSRDVSTYVSQHKSCLHIYDLPYGPAEETINNRAHGCEDKRVAWRLLALLVPTCNDQ